MLNRILHIENNEDIREIVHVSLSQIGGHDLVQCETPSEALAAAAAFLPQMLIAEAMNSGMHGIKIWKEIRLLKGCSNIPVVFLTASVDTKTVNGLRASGASGIISKPFDPMKLSENLQLIWVDHRRSASRSAPQ